MGTSALCHAQLHKQRTASPNSSHFFSTELSIAGRLGSGSPPLPPKCCTFLFAFLCPIHVFLCKAQSVGLGCSDRSGWLNPIFHVKIATLCATLPLQGALSVSAFQGSNCTHLFRLTLRKSTIKGGRQFPVHELVARCFCLGTFYLGDCSRTRPSLQRRRSHGTLSPWLPGVRDYVRGRLPSASEGRDSEQPAAGPTGRSPSSSLALWHATWTRQDPGAARRGA